MRLNLLELLRREEAKKAIRAELFDLQLEVIDGTEQFRAIHAGRRGGKSELIPRASALLVLDAGFNEVVVLAAETQKKARALHWANLQALVQKHSLPLSPNAQEGSWSTPWGAKIVFWGLNDEGSVELLRGFKMRACLFDEIQSSASKIPRLVSSVLEPALGDTGGPCFLFGTPSVTRSGPWADICLGVTPGWSTHHWDVRQNKRFPRDAESMLQQVLLRNKWTWDNPIFQREWLGLFVNALGMQVFRYEPSRNTADSLPVPLDRGFATLGIDFGTTDDPCAWVVVWSPRGAREIYVLEAQRHYGMLPDDAAEVTNALIERWSPQRIVGDGGGLGAPYVAAYNRRYGHLTGRHVGQADKQGKLGQIAIVNGELESGRIKLLPAAADLGAEWQVLPWKDEKKVEEHPEFPDDLSDAARYAINHHLTDVPAKPVTEPTPAEREAEARRARQRRAAERQTGGFFR